MFEARKLFIKKLRDKHRGSCSRSVWPYLEKYYHQEINKTLHVRNLNEVEKLENLKRYTQCLHSVIGGISKV